jgi:hypothetical protein
LSKEKKMSTFDINNIPPDQLVAFYGLSFAAAIVDGEIEKDEMLIIYETLDLSPLSEEYRKKVHEFIINPPDIESCLEKLSNGSDELRFAVVVSVVEVVLADDIIVPEEQDLLDKVCEQLKVQNSQRDAIIHFVKESRRIQREGLDDNTAEKVLKNAISGLGAVGVPITAVYFSGTVIGLSAAGITSGLAALGLGAGMIPGVGVAILVGVGVFLGLKSLMGDSKEEKEAQIKAEKERKAQLVIKNLQETINAIIEKIKNLEQKAHQSDANEQAIQILRDRLTTLQRALQKRKAIAA